MRRGAKSELSRLLLSFLRSIDIRSRSRIHKAVLGSIGVMVVIAVLLAFSHWSTANTPTYRLAAVKRGSIVSTVTATGTVLLG
jgi:hypothetical protein